MKVRKFVDSVKAVAWGGKGGDGCVGFRREACVDRGGPDGGDGARGGHVILKADRNEDSLVYFFFHPELKAEPGGDGEGQQRHGRNGKDLLVKVPCGTQVTDTLTGERLCDLVNHGDEHIIARGGKGGNGNCHWQTSTHQTPLEHTDGEDGEQRTLLLELKVMADGGLIGYPNAGKSTLLSVISQARPKIAPYPFTTLNPILGSLRSDDYRELKIVDIPGLIQGAHKGLGLGDGFLKHIERTRFFIFVIDMAGTEARDPTDDYRLLRRELKLYNPELLKRPFIVVANKMDLPDAAKNLAAFKRRTKTRPHPISGLTGAGIPDFIRALFEFHRSFGNPEKSDSAATY